MWLGVWGGEGAGPRGHERNNSFLFVDPAHAQTSGSDGAVKLSACSADHRPPSQTKAAFSARPPATHTADSAAAVIGAGWGAQDAQHVCRPPACEQAPMIETRMTIEGRKAV